MILNFALCTFNLRDQQTKRERMVKTINFGKKVYICLLYVHDESQDMLML